MIDALFPDPATDLTDDEVLARYVAGVGTGPVGGADAGVGTGPTGGADAGVGSGPMGGAGAGLEARVAPPTPAGGWLRVNFVASLDGSATAEGVSGELGGDDDLRVFDLLRRIADVVLVAAGTVRDEGYGPMRLHDEDVAWRRAHGMPDHPVFAIVTGSASLDPASTVFTEAPVRPIVLTSASAAASAKGRALAAVAEVVACGEDDVDASRVREALVERGIGRIHCEGGPSFLGALVAADLVDELCLSIDPSLEGGAGSRIVTGSSPSLRRMRLAQVLRGAGDVLLTRYVRDR